MPSQEPDAGDVRILHMPRGRSVIVLVASAVFVVVGLLVFTRVMWIAWLAFLLGGAGLVTSIAELIFPSWLKLGADGFTTWRFLRPTTTRRWTDCGPFSAEPIARTQELVSYRLADGSEKYLSPGYGGLEAGHLADLLNDYRGA